MSDNLQTAALVGVLALGGVLVWREFDKRHETAAANGAAGAQLPGASTQAPGGLLTGTLPAGTTAPSGGVAGQLDELRRQQEAAAKTAQIDTLRRDLARIHNDIDVLVVQAQSIKTAPVDPTFAQSVRERVWAECKEQHKLFPTTQCLQAGTREKAEAAIAPAWQQRQQAQLAPIQAQLSRLNAEQQATVANLAQLGYVVPLAQTKQVTV